MSDKHQLDLPDGWTVFDDGPHKLTQAQRDALNIRQAPDERGITVVPCDTCNASGRVWTGQGFDKCPVCGGKNLLQETIEALARHDLSISDVIWVGSYNGDYAITWQEFAHIADIEYDDGYGTQEVAGDLVVVGENWWFERWEYDGSEGWRVRTYPQQNTDGVKSFETIVNDRAYAGLRRINSGEE